MQLPFVPQLTLLIPLLSLALSKPVTPEPPQPSPQPPCYYLPSDPYYPTPFQWQTLNASLHGSLLATTPLALPCHNTQPGFYNSTICAEIRKTWPLPQTHYQSSSSIMSNFFTNNSCNPFSPPATTCDSSGYVSYSARVQGVRDVQKTIAFAKRHNVRLVIRNTGHDYLGKSNGPGAVAIWTHHLKSIEVLHNYTHHYRSRSGSTTLYTGPAMKLAAGVQGFEAQKAASGAGYILVTGNCDTIGIAGGYTQGGGHGQLTSRFGLAADQVLEWEVVLASGEVVVATPEGTYKDLYWALSGGGGGVFGVVMSVTVRVYEELRTVAGSLSFSASGGDEEAVELFIQQLGALLDAQGVAVWLVTGDSFSLMPVSIPGGGREELQTVLNPVIELLDKENLTYSYHINEFSTFYESYEAMTPEHNLTELHGGGRFIPRSVLDSNLHGLTSRLWNILESGNETVISGISVNASQHHTNHLPANSVNPAWRDAAISLVVGLYVSLSSFLFTRPRQWLVIHALLPQLEDITPSGGSYLNEADPNQPDWQRTFYGESYGKLLEVKRRYDPEGIFYALTGVGSEDRVQGDDGRLCQSDHYLTR
ncbi:hypothetical protein BDW75DRAFT_233576 [Aspergillus navahoensis]